MTTATLNKSPLKGARTRTGAGVAAPASLSGRTAMAVPGILTADMLKEQLAKLGSLSSKKLEVTTRKTFVLPDGTETDGPIELTVVEFISKNLYYPNAYNPNDIRPPVCFAIHPMPTMLVPSANSPARQHKDCTTCPQNQFQAGGAKPCKNIRQLAVMLHSEDDAEKGDLLTLSVAPTSLRNFDRFAASLLRTHGMLPLQIVVSVGFAPSHTYPVLTFSDPAPLEHERAMALLQRRAEALDLLQQEPDLQAYMPAQPVRPPVPRQRAVPPKRAARQ